MESSGKNFEINSVFYLVDYKDKDDLFLRLQEERQKAS